jgi:hypothetical protein
VRRIRSVPLTYATRGEPAQALVIEYLGHRHAHLLGPRCQASDTQMLFLQVIGSRTPA